MRPHPRPPRRHFHPRPYPGYGYGPYPWAYPVSTEVFYVEDPCTRFDPVLASNNKTYDNPCLARRAGQSVVRRLPRHGMSVPRDTGLGDFNSLIPTEPLAVVGLLTAGYFLIKSFKKK